MGRCRFTWPSWRRGWGRATRWLYRASPSWPPPMSCATAAPFPWSSTPSARPGSSSPRPSRRASRRGRAPSSPCTSTGTRATWTPFSPWRSVTGSSSSKTPRRRMAPSIEAGAPASILGAMRLRGVFDDDEPVTLRHGENGVHVARVPVEVHGDDGARPRRDARLEGRGLELPGLALGVDDHGNGAAVAHDIGGGHEGEARYNHLVARPHPRRHEGQVKRHRPIRDGYAVGRPAEGGEVALELPDERSQRADPARAHRLHHVGDLFLAYRGRGYGDSRRRRHEGPSMLDWREWHGI